VIRVEDLRLRAGRFRLAVSLEVRAGEYFVLIGPSGAGKTLLLESLCGLVGILGGRIEIAGRDVTRREPRERHIGYVPQDGMLFPHLSVRDNIAFALRARGSGRAECRRQAERMSEMLGIRHLLDRGIRGLSGGERQRVALARALARRPRVLLLDEPVSALDEETRDAILLQLRQVQRATGVTALHVCHNLEEMLRVADRVGVLRRGRLVQVGTPEELRRRPADPRVARILRLGTVLTGWTRGRGDEQQIDLRDFSIPAPPGAEGRSLVLIRSGEVRPVPPGQGKNGIRGVVRGVAIGEFSVMVEVAVGQTRLRAELPRDEADRLALAENQPVNLVLTPRAVQAFPRSSRRRLSGETVV